MTNNTIPLISISFKNTSDDLELRNWLMKHSNRSGFIKDILRKVMIEEMEREKKMKQLYKN